ncbi:uncharacterized protein [Eucyclogobius newberryi]|uniref:uncharacterized protein n=1 Tax=Eucyclogobius newberryi TaxID=166745 RepID=UPI003B596830
MGNCCCCQNKGPCDSAEETSLLQNDSKAAVPPAETPGALSVGGTCGPGLEEDISKDQLHKEAETETFCTQENGTLQKSSLQTDASSNKSPQHTVNSAHALGVDIQARMADSEGAEQQSTLTPPQLGCAHAGWNVSKTTSVEEETAAEDKCLNGTAVAVCTETPSLTETNPKEEHSIMDTINNNNEECPVSLDKCAAKQSTETVQMKEEAEQHSTEPAAPHSQVFPIVDINEEVNVNAEASCSDDKDDPDTRSSPVCVEANGEETQSHVPECSVGPVSTGSDHRGVDGLSSTDPHTTAAAEECQSSQQVQICAPEYFIKDACPETIAENTETGITTKEAAPGEDCEETQGGSLEKTECASSEALAEEVFVVSSTEQLPESCSPAKGGDAAPMETPAATKSDDVDDLENSEEDLYRGEEDISAELGTEAGAPSLSEPFLKLKDGCSLARAVDILPYSEREWKGNTAKSALIRKGYKEISQTFSSLRRVRGDNYCALRATLYQVLCHTTQMPQWLREDSITMLPKELEAEEGLICQWIFPGECLRGDGTGDVTQQLQSYMECLQKKWQAAVDCASPAERQQLCEQWFQGGEEELGLLEALKVLMLARSVELHGSMQKGDDTPLFCWLLFARDSSDCPRSFLANHLSHVGLSAGLEQVEMFLLGYALRCTIQVYRLYKADTEEFVTFYPDDHKDDWPRVCLVTEDDRHYNVPVREAADPPEEPRCS